MRIIYFSTGRAQKIAVRYLCLWRPQFLAHTAYYNQFLTFFASQGTETRTRAWGSVAETGRPVPDQCKEGGHQLRPLEPRGLQLDLIKFGEFGMIQRQNWDGGKNTDTGDDAKEQFVRQRGKKGEKSHNQQNFYNYSQMSEYRKRGKKDENLSNWRRKYERTDFFLVETNF